MKDRATFVDTSRFGRDVVTEKTMYSWPLAPWMINMNIHIYEDAMEVRPCVTFFLFDIVRRDT